MLDSARFDSVIVFSDSFPEMNLLRILGLFSNLDRFASVISARFSSSISGYFGVLGFNCTFKGAGIGTGVGAFIPLNFGDSSY